jgi:hypothetical protein
LKVSAQGQRSAFLHAVSKRFPFGGARTAFFQPEYFVLATISSNSISQSNCYRSFARTEHTYSPLGITRRTSISRPDLELTEPDRGRPRDRHNGRRERQPANLHWLRRTARRGSGTRLTMRPSLLRFMPREDVSCQTRTSVLQVAFQIRSSSPLPQPRPGEEGGR